MLKLIPRDNPGLVPHFQEPSAGPPEVSTAAELVSRLYAECATLACAKPKVLSFFSASMNKNKIRITRDLSVVRSADVPAAAAEDDASYKQQVIERNVLIGV